MQSYVYFLCHFFYRDYGLRQMLKFVRSSLILGNMDEWVRYHIMILCNNVGCFSSLIWMFLYHWYPWALSIDFVEIVGTSQFLSKERWYRWARVRRAAFAIENKLLLWKLNKINNVPFQFSILRTTIYIFCGISSISVYCSIMKW